MVNPFSAFLWFGVHRFLTQRGKETSLILRQPMQRQREICNYLTLPRSKSFTSLIQQISRMSHVNVQDLFWQLGSSCSFSSLHRPNPVRHMDFQLIRDSQWKNFKTSVIILIWFVLAKGNVLNWESELAVFSIQEWSKLVLPLIAFSISPL